MSRSLFIKGSGISTPAPGEQFQQIAALLSGAPIFERHPKWIGADGQRQIMGFVAELSDMSDFPARVAMLLHGAFCSCRDDEMVRYGNVETAPMIVLLPRLLQRSVFQDSFRKACVDLDFSGVSDVRLHFGDAPLGLWLLQQAMLDDTLKTAYVAAADSLVTPFLLDFLATQGLVRDRLNPWGIIPSEAAACLLISSRSGFSQFLGCSVTRENESLSNLDRGLIGRALCDAIDQICAVGDFEFSEVLTDASAERWRAEELGFIKSERPILCADNISWHYINQAAGDLGTASALISVASACHRRADALILSGDRSGQRAAASIKILA